MSAISAALRGEVVRRADNRCEYCRLPQQLQIGTFPIDHIVPRSQSGSTQLENLALACHQCNAHKWAFHRFKDPHTGVEVAIFDPRTQVWAEHFRWSSDGAGEIEGLSETGRATIELLQMNASNVVEIRRLLADLGIPVV